MYGGDAKPNLQALAAAGLRLEEPEQSDDTECYPQNWQALLLFNALDTQWRVANHLVLGLHYEAVPGVMDMLCIKPALRPQLFADMRIMEAEAVALFREKRQG